MLTLKRVLSVILAGLFLAVLLAGPSTSTARVKPAKSDAGAETGHIDVPEELRKVLPRGTVLYYAKVTRKLGTQTDHWVVEALDVHSGKTRAVMTDKTSGLDQLQPRAISPDRRYLLVSARQPDRSKILLELEIATGKWRTLAKYAFHGEYSPDGRRIVIAYAYNPETFYGNPVMRIGIIDRNGKRLKTLPCEAKKCYHPTWIKNGTEILYVEGQSRRYFPSIRTELARLKTFNVETGEIRTLADYQNQSKKIYYPAWCNRRYIFTLDSTHKTYIPKLNRLIHPSKLIIQNEQLNQEIEFNRFSGFTCIPGQPGYLISDNIGDYKDGRPLERTYLALFHIPTQVSIRITPGPTIETAYLGPILSLP